MGTWRSEKIRQLWKEDIGIDTGDCLGNHRVISLWHSEKSDLQFFTPAAIGDESFYLQLHKKRWYFQPHKWEFKEAARHIAGSNLVLELGAGLQPFRAFIGADRYFAMDPFTARHAVPDPHRKFDVVCAFQVLEHVPDPLEFIATAKYWLKPGGLIFVGVPNRECYLSDLRDFALDMPPHHVSRWSDRALQSLAQSTRLTVEAISKSPLENWEASLYRMTRFEDALPRSSAGRSRASRIIAYSAACCLTAALPIPKKVIGSTLLLRARSE